MPIANQPVTLSGARLIMHITVKIIKYIGIAPNMPSISPFFFIGRTVTYQHKNALTALIASAAAPRLSAGISCLNATSDTTADKIKNTAAPTVAPVRVLMAISLPPDSADFDFLFRADLFLGIKLPPHSKL